MAKTLSSQCRGTVGKLLEGFIGAEVYLGEPGASQGKPLILTKSCGYSSHFADGQVKTQSGSQSLVGRQSLMYQLCFLKNTYLWWGLGLYCCAWAFSSFGEQGLPSSCGAWASQCCGL